MSSKRYPPDWKARRRIVLDRDDYQCRNCQSRYRLEVDHIKPIGRGGTHDFDNLQTLCRTCHIVKTKLGNIVHHVRGQKDWARYMARESDAVL